MYKSALKSQVAFSQLRERRFVDAMKFLMGIEDEFYLFVLRRMCRFHFF